MLALPVDINVSDRPLSTATFDAGINASSAWTGHLESASSDGDPPEGKEGVSSNDTLRGDVMNESRPARALYDFDGEEQFRELVVSAGDTLAILKEEVADGWSLARFQSTVGLIPRKYYAFTAEFATSPSLIKSGEETASITTPLQPQVTGQYFASIRNTLLGGKSLNRFSNFVTSGAEEWVLKGADEQNDVPPTGEMIGQQDLDEDNSDEDDSKDEGTGSHRVREADRHFVEMPPSWKAKSPPFRVLVHSPTKQTSPLSGSFTVYAVTSLFSAEATPSHSRYPTASESSNSLLSVSSSTRSLTPTPETYASNSRSKVSGESGPDDISQTSITVYRRFSHFAFLHTALSRKLPGIALPPLPEKQYAGRFSDEFVEARRGDLEKWISRVVRHPVARYAEVLVFFLSCDNEVEWRRNWPRHLTPSVTPGPSFYSQVYHPAFNLDADDAADAVDRFERHINAVGQGVQGLRTVLSRVRDVGVDMSVAQRDLSYSILSLITSTPHVDSNGSAPTPSLAYKPSPWDEDGDIPSDSEENRKGLLNDEGAWCWRDDCEDCLRLTKALQKMAETLQSTADIYDDHARRTQLITHDMLKDVSHPASLYAPVIDTHRATLSRYKETSAEHNASQLSPTLDNALT
ncbi:hypothetical protein FRC02_008791 [Tulasnella sp. 418]|nr:hypothetical protein FRC02_008791 [Tulasnella sp. 418]